MTTPLDIITQAYRESNITALGATLTDGQKTEGLSSLQRVVSSVRGFEVGEKLLDWPVGAAGSYANFPRWNESYWTRPVANVRLVVNAGTTQTLILPAKISDGARLGITNPGGDLAAYPVTLNANGRLIEGANQLVLNTNGLNAEWFYRADLANWTRISNLVIDDPFPYPSEFDDAFITLLAMRLNPRYGRAMAAESQVWLTRSVNFLQSRYRQTVVTPADLAVLIPSVQAYSSYFGYDRAPRGLYGWMG